MGLEEARGVLRLPRLYTEAGGTEGLLVGDLGRVTLVNKFLWSSPAHARQQGQRELSHLH